MGYTSVLLPSTAVSVRATSRKGVSPLARALSSSWGACRLSYSDVAFTSHATRAVGEAGAVSMGEGWLLSHAAVFKDSERTRALVKGPFTTLKTCSLLPELPMYLVAGEDILQLWGRIEEFAEEARGGGSGEDIRDGTGTDDGNGGGGDELHPPYWAVPWVGGQGVARYILDNPEVVRGKTVLDVGSGCGVAALAAAHAGASLVCANDIDPLAAVAFLANAEACGLVASCGTGPGPEPRLGSEAAVGAGVGASAAAGMRTGEPGAEMAAGGGGEEEVVRSPSCILQTSFEDLLGTSAADVAHFDVIMAGDVCFMKGLSGAFQSWLASVSDRREGCVTLLGDPSRWEQWAPQPGWAAGMERVAAYDVNTDAADVHPLTEGLATRHTVVWRSG